MQYKYKEHIFTPDILHHKYLDFYTYIVAIYIIKINTLNIFYKIRVRIFQEMHRFKSMLQLILNFSSSIDSISPISTSLSFLLTALTCEWAGSSCIKQSAPSYLCVIQSTP